MPFASPALNTAAVAVAGSIAYISLHSGAPGTTGTNEISGGSPAYARKAPTYGTPDANNRVDLQAALLFNVPASTTVAAIGFWTALTGGTFLGSATFAAAETFSAAGELSLTSAAVDADAV